MIYYYLNLDIFHLFYNELLNSTKGYKCSLIMATAIKFFKNYIYRTRVISIRVLWCKLSAEWPLMINMDNPDFISDVRFTCTNRETVTERSRDDTVGEYCYISGMIL